MPKISILQENEYVCIYEHFRSYISGTNKLSKILSRNEEINNK